MKPSPVLIVLALAPFLALGQETTAPPSTPAATASESAPTLSADQIRDLIRQVAEKDMENEKKQRDYTYIERVEEHRLDGKGQVKSTETRTREVMMLYGDQVERLIAKNDRPLPEKDAAKEDERIQKLTDKRKNETDEQRAKRLKEEEKDREETRQFVSEIADAYNFHLAGIENLEGRDTYMIDADPRPGFEPHVKGAKFLPKFRFRVWIDKAESQWVKLDAQCIDTVSLGLFLARIHKGSRILIEETRVNDEVWLPRHMEVKVDVRLALMKNFDIEQDVTFRDYKKFRSDTRIVPLGQAQEQP
ncbi:MAG: hypothetical protein LAO03_02135 [Acidobacteriia bacterium]|nr:hypothetical protein [Terriglobia bacterium]